MSLTAIGLAAGRIAIGAGIWAAPTAAWRALGLGTPDPRALAIGRLAASRDLVLGAWQLGALGDPRRLRRVTAAVAAVDGADALTFALATRDPDTRGAGVRGLAAALPAAVVGGWLAHRLRAPERI